MRERLLACKIEIVYFCALFATYRTNVWACFDELFYRPGLPSDCAFWGLNFFWSIFLVDMVEKQVFFDIFDQNTGKNSSDLNKTWYTKIFGYARHDGANGF